MGKASALYLLLVPSSNKLVVVLKITVPLSELPKFASRCAEEKLGKTKPFGV